MIEATIPEELNLIDDWLACRKSEASPCVTEDKQWKEWWCLYRWAKLKTEFAPFSESFVAIWSDEREGQADFKIFGSRDVSWIEVTEATVTEDRKAKAIARNISGVRLLGKPIRLKRTTKHPKGKTIGGGRFRGGVIGDIWEEAMVEDIEAAIRRKSQKPYAAKSILLIYPNSNASFAEREGVAEILEGKKIDHPFCSVEIIEPRSSLTIIKDNSVRFCSA